MRPRLWLSGLLWLGLAALAGVPAGPRALAQEAQPAEETAADDPVAEGSLQGEVLPRVYHLKDRNGELQAVPGFNYEDFMELLNQRRQLAAANRRPPFSIQDLELIGTASGTSAELRVKATIAVHDSGWVGVPLRMNGALLREQPVYAGPGEHVVGVQPEGDGLVVWVRGQSDQAHEVTLHLAVPVKQIGPQSRLRLSMPRAAVSRLQLQVPLARAAARVSEGSRLDAVRPLAGGKTELKVIGLTGDFELTWHPADREVARLPILEVAGEQLIRIHGRSVNTEATLKVSSLGSEFDRFQVRLPPGADYVGTPQVGVSLVAIDASSASGKLYEVRLDEKSEGPVEVRLVTERAHSAAQRVGGDEGGETLQLAGFEVPGAVRQWGTIDVQVEGNWQVLWEDNSLSSANAAGGTGFEYVQPYSLEARVVSQKTHVRVEPEYILLVGSEQAELRARLKYTIRGGKVNSLELDLAGWDVHNVGPDNLVDVDATIAGARESMAFQLLHDSSRELELTFEASRKIQPGDDSVELPLPKPADDVVSADVAVVSDDNVELVPRADQTTGLTSQSARPPMQLPDRQQPALYYRATGASPSFVADVTVHEQSISTAMTTQVEVGAEDTEVDQRITFQIDYEPTDHLTLNVPRTIRPERMTVVHEGERIEPAPVPAGLAGGEEATLVRVNLPTPRIGRCQLQIGYTVGHEIPRAEASTLLSVPLVVPGDGRLTANELTVVPENGIAVNYSPGAWRVEKPAPESAAPATLTLSADRAVREVTLGVVSKPRPTEDSTVVEQAWIQTHLTQTGRQDRAIFRFSTHRPRVQARLPSGADVRSLVLEVDGVRVVPESIRQGQLTIPLPGATRDHLLKIGYRFNDRAPEGSLALEGPQLPSASWVQQVYWQLVLPEDEQVLFAPSSYTEEFTWVWSDFFWQRRAALNRRDLDEWIGAARPDDANGIWSEAASRFEAAEHLPAGSPNRYLFSGVGRIESLNLYTLSRAQLVLFASLPILVCGLILIYFSAARHPAVLFVLAVLLAAGSITAPRSALLLAQGSALGLALVGVAVLLARMLPRQPAVLPARGSSHALLERSVTERYPRPPSSSQPPSTATDPLVPTSPEVDS